MIKNVGIFTTFHQWSEAYSLTGVVKHQLLSLIKHGYEPTLFVLNSFNDDDSFYNSHRLFREHVKLEKAIPQITTEPYHGVAATNNVPQQFEKDVAKIIPALEPAFKDIDILLCHDIIFQDSFLPYNAALRKMVLPKELKMFHWMHSGPSSRPKDMKEPISFLYSLPPQSNLIYMNSYGKVGAAEMYGIMPDQVSIVHNPIDYRTLPFAHPLIEQIVETYTLNEADIIGVYPLSTTRMGAGGKQLPKALKIMAALKKNGNSVRYIIPNAHANADNEKNAIEDMLLTAESMGLNRDEVCFTSTLGKNWEHGIPHDVVLQLFQLSDLFIFPSVSENCPLILLEAALTKNLLVLNEDFSPMKDFVGPNALYFKFDSINTVTNHPRGEDAYYSDVAKIIASELNHNYIHLAARDIRQKFNMDTVFKKELEPLFYQSPRQGTVQMVVGTPKAAMPPKEQVEADIRNLMKEKYGLEL